MRNTCTIALLFLCLTLLAQSDSVNTKKSPKNSLEIGLTYLSFLDGFGFKIGDPSIQNAGPINLFSFSYTRKINEKISLQLSHFTYDRFNFFDEKDNNLEHGHVGRIGITSTNLSLLYSKVLYRDKYSILELWPSIGLSLRYFGAEHVLLGYYPGGFDSYGFVHSYDDLGVNTGLAISYIFKERISLSADFDYLYFFDYAKWEEAPSWQPKRNMITFQPKKDRGSVLIFEGQASIAAMPGNSLPSKNSSKAPPPVEI